MARLKTNRTGLIFSFKFSQRLLCSQPEMIYVFTTRRWKMRMEFHGGDLSPIAKSMINVLIQQSSIDVCTVISHRIGATEWPEELLVAITSKTSLANQKALLLGLIPELLKIPRSAIQDISPR